jgi:putative ABC transport system substrate-binding protein
MRRREFITLLGGAAVALPRGASAQLAKRPIRIGLLPFGSPSNAYDLSLVEAFRSGLRATIFGFPAAARDGALIAYGPDYLHMNQRAPYYVNQILKGTKPADLPVELPTKINLLVNLKTAKMLGLEVPLSLLIRADELIE